eukprot:8669755-Prorocentrum_lima.AAC.1
MTSSLVGSEMCIRDSSEEPQSREDGDQPKEARPVASTEGRRPEADRGAVSYTHLTLPTICSV